jgi:hypothetical protein
MARVNRRLETLSRSADAGPRSWRAREGDQSATFCGIPVASGELAEKLSAPGKR